MSLKSQGMIAEVNADTKIADQDLEMILKVYPTAWGHASATDGKLLVGAEFLPPNPQVIDFQDMLDQFKNLPEMMQYFGNFPATIDKKCAQPFEVLNDDKGNCILAMCIEGDFDQYEPEANLTSEYMVFRDHIIPLVTDAYELCDQDITKTLKMLGGKANYTTMLNMIGDRGCMMFLSNTGQNLLIETKDNPYRKDYPAWGSASNEFLASDTIVEDSSSLLPNNNISTDPPVVKEEKMLTLAEKRALREQQQKKPAAGPVAAPAGVHATDAKKGDLKSSTTVSKPKGPFLFTLKLLNPKLTETQVEAGKNTWSENFGTLPQGWKKKNETSSWILDFTAGLPYEKLLHGSIFRAKFNSDGSPRNSGKGFAALDNFANDGKKTENKDKPSGTAGSSPPKAPVSVIGMPIEVRERIVKEINNLDGKSKRIMSVEEVRSAEERKPSFFSQTGTSFEDVMSWPDEAIDKWFTPDAASLIKSLRHQILMLNWKPAAKKEEPVKQEVKTPPAADRPLTLAEKRALREAQAKTA